MHSQLGSAGCVYAEVIGKARMQYVHQEVAGCGSGVQVSCIHVMSWHACQDYASWAVLPVCEVTDYAHVQCVHVALAGWAVECTPLSASCLSVWACTVAAKWH